jgi:hypothetical protein
MESMDRYFAQCQESVGKMGNINARMGSLIDKLIVLAGQRETSAMFETEPLNMARMGSREGGCLRQNKRHDKEARWIS